MKVFIAFLLTMFLIGGTRFSRLPTSRPVVFTMCCIVVGISFLSLTVIG